jgi:gamma-glutamyltranspeptidase/glutathione hydrolase
LNASGRSSADWGPRHLDANEGIPERGWNAVTTPGAVSAWVALSKRFGALPFETLFGPAIGYAENGFPVSPIIAHLWGIAAGMLGHQPGFSDCFMPGGRAPRAGDIFRNPDQATSLRLIAQTKGDAFYTGVLAEKMAADAAKHGAPLSMADLAAHKATWCGTISQDYAGSSLQRLLRWGRWNITR